VGPFALRKEVLRELRIVRHQLWSVIATFQIHALALTIAHTFASFPMFFILFFFFSVSQKPTSCSQLSHTLQTNRVKR
jgi:hypothetical protein